MPVTSATFSARFATHSFSRLFVPRDRLTQSLVEGSRGGKAEVLRGPARVQAAARLAVGSTAVPDDAAAVTRELDDLGSQLGDTDFEAGADVHGLGSVIALGRKHERACAVVDVQELAR